MTFGIQHPKGRNGEKGQSLIEVAIALPVILLILLGTFDFGMALFSYSILKDAAQEGALYGSINPGNKAEIENRARHILPREEGILYSSPIDLRDSAIVVNIRTIGGACQGVSGNVANRVQVKVTYQYDILTPFVSEVIGTETIQLTSTATNVILQPPCK